MNYMNICLLVQVLWCLQFAVLSKSKSPLVFAALGSIRNISPPVCQNATGCTTQKGHGHSWMELNFGSIVGANYYMLLSLVLVAKETVAVFSVI